MKKTLDTDFIILHGWMQINLISCQKRQFLSTSQIIAEWNQGNKEDREYSPWKYFLLYFVTRNVTED